MDLSKRNAYYEVCVVGVLKASTTHIKDCKEAEKLYYACKNLYPNKTVLLCRTKPTVTKGQIDPDLY